MLRLSFRHILTLVVLLISCIVHSTPHLDAPTSPAPESAEEESASDAVTRLGQRENISITEVPQKMTIDEFANRFNKRDYYYSYRQELEVHVGTVFGIQDSSDDTDLVNALLGFSYLLPNDVSPKWELGANLSFVGHGHIHGVRRHIYNEKGSFRPYYEYGLMHKFVPDEKMASFSNWENYMALATVGLSDIQSPPRSVQVELQLAVGAEDVLAMFTFGYAWGF
jgi:hypothetical protein